LLAGQWPEEGSIPVPPPDPFNVIQRGLMPPLLQLDKPEAWTRWWEGYVATYLERDLRQISQIDALVDFHRVMEFLALRNGQLLNQSEVARDAGISQPTTHRYLNLLEATSLVERLPAFTSNRTTRLVKSPKLYWTDPGLAAFLAGYYDRDSLSKGREAGAFFESLILHHLKVLAQLLTPRGRLFYWRTTTGHEVDFVLEQGRRLLAFEVKLTTNPRFGDADGLRLFLSENKAVGGVLLHDGQEIKRLDERIVALPWTMLTG
jgi:predicted AAA+ superfamily ATPase